MVAFESAVAADPSLSDIARRIDVLRFRTQQNDLARARRRGARRPARRGDPASYTTAIAASPDSPFLYRELAGGRAAEGRRRCRARALPQGGGARSERRALARSRSAESSRIAPTSTARSRPTPRRWPSSRTPASNAHRGGPRACRARAAARRVPRHRSALPQITRGDLAALIGMRLAPLLQAGRRRDAVLITDVRNHWAATWIMAVARAGVMEPFANHAFQPRAVVRRIDLAQAVSRLLAAIRAPAPEPGRPWESARLKFSDLSPRHLAYVSASQSVASGVMTTGPDNSFRAVQGRDRRGGDRRDRSDRGARRHQGPAMSALTLANQLTLLRMLLIPAFVILVGLRPSRVGADGVRDGGHHRRPRRPDRAAVGPEDEPWRVARSDGRQAAAGDDVRRADAAGARASRTACRSG